jgi:hypothetical protein
VIQKSKPKNIKIICAVLNVSICSWDMFPFVPSLALYSSESHHSKDTPNNKEQKKTIKTPAERSEFQQRTMMFR